MRFFVRLEHLPGYSTRDHLYGAFASFIESGLHATGYASRQAALLAFYRLAAKAAMRTTFDGEYSWSITTHDEPHDIPA